ncbi:MAG: 50S ribosomal protein L14 [Candidatus Omnitrophica bacterium]|nr:50S ribosomal protein L14 [Candidatus Omnitrophota bacterium]
MIMMKTILDVADNTGAKRASCIGVLGRTGKLTAEIGDVIRCNIKEATPDAIIKKGEVAKGVIVRSASPLKRVDGSYLKFDRNAVVLIDDQGNPKGTRIFGPVARELREKKFLKIASLAPEVI